MNINAGDTVLHYHIIAEIGHGSVGRVYHAFDTRLHRDVALKFLHHSPNLREDTVARFLVEARAVARLDHLNICNLHTVEVYSSHYFMVMSLYRGQDLERVLRKKSSSLAYRLGIFRQVLEGVRYAHQQGIVHRDLKPSNVFITHEEIVKILDFGFARLPDSQLTQAGEIIGTISYSSPEQIRGEASDALTDIWSLGVMLFELVTGKLPFQGSLPQIIAAVLKHEPKSLASYLQHPALSTLLQQCLAKDKRERFASVTDLLAAFNALDWQDSVAEQEGLRQEGLGQDRAGHANHAAVTPAVALAQPSHATTPANASHANVSHVNASHASMWQRLQPLVGREEDRQELERILLDDAQPLLSIVGIGGAGKTRLAQQLCFSSKLAAHFRDGVYFIALDGLRDAGQIPNVIAHYAKLELAPQAASPSALWQQLATLLAAQSVLLVLDNLEHLIEDCAHDLEDLLQECPQLSILATSREVLKLEGEVVYELQGLSLPPDEAVDFLHYGATALFIENVQRLQAGFVVDRHKEAILAICRQLEGWPLGIELAAAWTRQLSPDEIAENIAASINFLKNQSRSHPARHQSARAAFEYSWQLLSAPEQQVLAHLAVFQNGFSLSAAQKVVGLTLAVLAALLDKSLIYLSGQRYQQHPLLYQFCQGKFAERSDTRAIERAHAYFFLELARHASQELSQGKQERHWRKQIQQERANINRAIQRMALPQEGSQQDIARRDIAQQDIAQQEASLALQLGMAIYHLEELRVPTTTPTSDALLPRLLELTYVIDDKQTRAMLLYIAALRLWLEGKLPQARHYYQQALDIGKMLADSLSISRISHQLALLEASAGNYQQSEAHAREGLYHRRQLADYVGISLALRGLSQTFSIRGDYLEAYKLLLEAVEAARHSGNQSYVAETLQALGLNDLWLGEYARALATLKESRAIYQSLGGDIGSNETMPLAYYHIIQGDVATAQKLLQHDRDTARYRADNKALKISLRYLGHSARVEGDLPKAQNYLQESLSLSYRDKDVLTLALDLHEWALLLFAKRAYQRALALWASVTAACQRYGYVIYPYERQGQNQALTQLKTLLPLESYQKQWQQGKALTLSEAAALVFQ